MSFRRNSRANNPLRRRSLLSQLLRLEDRLTPAVSIMGPHSAADLQILAQTAATVWTPLVTAPTAGPGQSSYISAANSWYFNLDRTEIVKKLNQSPFEYTPGYNTGSFTVSLPRPDGTFQRFRVWEVAMMEQGLADQYPDWHTFRGQGIDDPSATLAADVTELGFHAQVRSTDGHYYVDPYFHLDQSVYVAYYRKDLQRNDTNWACTVVDPTVDDSGSDSITLDGHTKGCNCAVCQAVTSSSVTANKTTNGTTLKTYRAAVAATGEYTAFFGGTVSAGQAAIVTAMNRVSGVYETELAIRMVLVDNANIVYTNSATDPYTNANGSTMLGENQTNIDAVIGTANYDIGHVFSTGGGGVAFLGCVGNLTNKARGVTGSPAPTGDAFWIDYVAHEMGHQFGANHTFNGTQGSAAGNRNAGTAYEPGSASSIMGYAGICGTDNLQTNSDPYFNLSSLDEITNYVAAGVGAGFTQTATGNAIPVANAGASYTIPAQTPFALTGSGTDADNDPLTYLWEERDLGAAQGIVGQVDNGSSPIFRMWTPTASPTRYFPRLAKVLDSTVANVGEILPTTARTMNFRLTVRDNKAGGGAYSMADTTVKTVVTGAPFRVTSPNTAVTWTGGGNNTVTWDVAGTTANGINAANVDIYLSTDGGNSFPTLLLGNTPNDGSESIALPNTPTSTARIMVRPVGNIFFDVSDANFTIVSGSSFNVTSVAPVSGSLVTAPLTQIDVTFSDPVNAATLANSDLVLSAGSVTANQLIAPNVVRFTVSGLTAEGNVSATIPSNAISDTLGNGVNSFVANYAVDIGTTSFGALAATGAAGTLYYSGTASGNVQSASDTDAFTINLEAGQTVSVLLTGDAALRGSFNLAGPGGFNQTVSAASAGAIAQLQATPVTSAGLYTLTVSSLASTTGAYSARLDLNALMESTAANDTPATAQSVGTGYDLGSGASVASVRGRTDLGIGALTNEVEPNNTTGTANDAAGDFTSVTSQNYTMTITGSNSASNDSDYFNIGAMQVGDIITVTISGVDMGLGTHTDPWARLYRAGSTTAVAANDDRVASTSIYFDSVIYRFSVTVADNYSIRCNPASGSGGTYTIGIHLENTGTAPNQGSGIYVETAAANGTLASSENASSVWKRVNYNATSTGSIGSVGDVDFVKYTLAAGDMFTATATSGGSADLAFALFNSAGTLLFDEKGLSDAYGLNSGLYGYRVATAGDYFVRVSGINSTTGSYTLNVDLSSTVTPPAPATGLDYFAFAVTAGQPFALGIDGLSAGTLNVDLVDASNTVLLSATAGTSNFDKVMTYLPAATGTLYARVTGAANVDYQLAITRGLAQDAETNDSFATAQIMLNNRAVGSISGSDDWYQVPVTAGQALTFTTTTPGDAAGEFTNNLDPAIEVYDPSNVLVGSNDNSAPDGRNAVLSTSATATGNYRVRVRNMGGTSGEYTLGMSVAAFPAPQVSTIVVDDGTIQRSRVRSVAVTFDQIVTLPTNPADAFQLVRTSPTNDTVTLNAAVSNSATQTTVTLTFTGAVTEFTSLADGRYTLTVIGSQVIGAGSQPMAANVTNNFLRLFGDSDGSGTVEANDLLAFRIAFLNPVVTSFDYDNNGNVDSGDFLAFRLHFLASI
ncbi:MAG: pre-peptidase C-terminal domain-containing protein [Gemmataceae bacterium]|nr:pre-peptidase C-terminal domain-containing protein [Gemmataceae bacterium]